MAIQLLVALVALALLHVLPRLAQWRGDGAYRRWAIQLADTRGYARVALAVLPPTALCLLISLALAHGLAGTWLLQPAFALVVLVYCFGPRDFEADVAAVLDAPDTATATAAAQHLADDGSAVAWDVRELGRAAVYAALRRRFAVLLWFFALGPAGALAYRLVQTLARDAELKRADDPDAARFIANAADWIPAQLLTFTLALVGHWEAVIASWQRWHGHAAPTSWYRDGPDFLGAAAQADIRTDVSQAEAYALPAADPRSELLRLRSTLLRALLAWLSVVALIVIGGWLR